MVTARKIHEKVQDGSRFLFIRLFAIVGMVFGPALRVLAQDTGGTPTTGGEVNFDLNDTPFLQAICSFVKFLSGPAAVIIGLIVIAGGGLLIAFGGKRAISGVLVGVAGVLVALSAPQLIKLFTTETGCPA